MLQMVGDMSINLWWLLTFSHQSASFRWRSQTKEFLLATLGSVWSMVTMEAVITGVQNWENYDVFHELFMNFCKYVVILIPFLSTNGLFQERIISGWLNQICSFSVLMHISQLILVGFKQFYRTIFRLALVLARMRKTFEYFNIFVNFRFPLHSATMSY